MERYALLAALSILLAAPDAVAQEAADEPAQEESSSQTDSEAGSESGQGDDDAADDDEPSDEPNDDEDLVAVPDRPTFSAAAWTVPAAHAQIEAGVDVVSADDTAISIPVAARLGLADSFELSVGLPAIVVPLSDAPTELGSLRLAGKVAGNVSDALSVGAMPFYDIPSSTGDETVFSQSTFGAMGLVGLDLGGGFGLFSNVGVSTGPSTNDTDPRELFYAASVGAGWGITDSLSVALEGFGVFGQFADPQLGGDLSFGFAVTDRFVLDAYFLTSAQGEATSFTGGVGVTYLR